MHIDIAGKPLYSMDVQKKTGAWFIVYMLRNYFLLIEVYHISVVITISYQVSKDTGIVKSKFLDWKSGCSISKVDKPKALADYLEEIIHKDGMKSKVVHIGEFIIESKDRCKNLKKMDLDNTDLKKEEGVCPGRSRRRLIYGLAFVLLFLTEAFIALFVHDAFVRPYVGDVLVVSVVYAFIRIFFPDGVPWLWLYVVLFAVIVEVTQYFQLAALLGLEKYWLANVFLGSVFDLGDIICYVAGGLLIAAAENVRRRLCAKK